jgi:glycosyltransferase involved in cell wall biosynthesis
MKVSAFTFIKNGQILGYPFIQSILSVLPIVDEFVVNVGNSEDGTLEALKAISDSKIRIVHSKWSDQMTDRGYVYGQQKMIAQFNCSGDWLFYVEGDEVYHEDDLEIIAESMKSNLNNSQVEALALDFIHFYGNNKTYLDSPGWYRSEVRIIKGSIRSYAPDGLFWLVLDQNKKGRYPKAKKVNAHCYHYGWVRTERQMNLKSQKVQKYWSKDPVRIDYSAIDNSILKVFEGSHPKIMDNFFVQSNGIFQPNKNYIITPKQKKHRLMKKLEKLFGMNLSKKHYKLIK